MGKKLILFCLIISWAPAWGYQFAPAATPTAAVDSNATATPAPTPAATSTGINPAANQGNQSQSSGAGANAAAAMAMMAAAMPMLMNPTTAPMGAALMALAALAAMQSGADQGAANQSAQTAAATTDTSATTTPTTTPYTSGTSSVGFANPTQSPSAQAALAAAGYTLTPTTMTTPDGTSSSLSSLGSSGGLAAAGLDPKAIEEAQKIASEVGNGSNVAGLGVVDGGGGSGGAKTAAALPPLPEFKFNNPFALKSGAKAALIAGKTVNYDGEPIGVRGGDIFEMVHAAYDKRAQRGSFIESSAAASAATIRVPASATSSYVPAVTTSGPNHSPQVPK